MDRLTHDDDEVQVKEKREESGLAHKELFVALTRGGVENDWPKTCNIF
jgi:hypothetical protein